MIEDGEIATLHVPFRKWLDDNGILYRYSTPGKRTSENASDADFWITSNNRLLQIEFKRPKKGMLSDSQKERFADMEKHGCKVHMVKELGIACALVTEFLAQAHDFPRPTLGRLIQLYGRQWRETPSGYVPV